MGRNDCIGRKPRQPVEVDREREDYESKKKAEPPEGTITLGEITNRRDSEDKGESNTSDGEPIRPLHCSSPKSKRLPIGSLLGKRISASLLF